jgi:uncharacterized protein with von Willebrand factor type A (vWA) domain
VLDQPLSGRTFLRNVLDFGRELRREGMTADLAAVLDYARALELIDIGDREEVRAAGASLFVRRREEIEPYDRAFTRFWRRRLRLAQVPVPPPPTPPEEGPDGHSGGESETSQLAESQAQTSGEAPDGPPALTISPDSWSAAESMRHKSFERMTAAELREAERAIDQMRPLLPLRRTRRWELDSRGPLLAPREMLRRNLSAGGDLVEWVWRRPRRRPRNVVLVCDISGSMERHSRLLLRFGHAMSRAGIRMEAFAFGTRLTRITPMLRRRDPDSALREVSEAVGDWSGGTRIGHAFREFNQEWARRVLRTSGIVIVVSDGWDRGDPALVGSETERLQRNSHLLVWLNPLAGSSGYRPLAQGMAAAFPFIDRFLPCHDLESLQNVAAVLAEQAFAQKPVALPMPPLPTSRSYRTIP